MHGPTPSPEGQDLGHLVMGNPFMQKLKGGMEKGKKRGYPHLACLTVALKLCTAFWVIHAKIQSAAGLGA